MTFWDGLTSFFSSVVNTLEFLFVFLTVGLFILLFWFIQYWIIRAYIWFFKLIWSIPLVQGWTYLVLERVFGLNIKDKKFSFISFKE